jgi:hypothetical protein
MKIRIPRWNGVGYEQVSTNWFGYDSPTGTNKVLDVTKTLLGDTPDNEEELFLLITALTVPLGQTYYFGIERVLRLIDTDGSPKLDADGNEIFITKIPENRTVREGVESYVSANIFPKNTPLIPMLEKTVLENGDIHLSVSDILPTELILNETFWSIYGEDGNMLYSIYREENDDLRNIIIPNKVVVDNTDLRVTCIHGTLDGIMSKAGELKIDTDKRITSLTGTSSVNSHTDYLFAYDISTIYDEITTPIQRIELVDSAHNTIIKTFIPTINKSVLVPVGILTPDSGYELRFYLNPITKTSSSELEIIKFYTAIEMITFYKDESYTYRNKYRFANSSDIIKMQSKYVEKRADGRFLGINTLNELNWFVMDNGVPTIPYDVICPNSFTGKISCFNLHRDYILIVGTDLVTGKDRMTFAIDDMYGGEIIFKDTYLFDSIDSRSIEFIHSERLVLFTDLSNNEVKTINIDKIEGETTRRIKTHMVRPDNIIEKGRFVDVGRDKILMVGGNSDSVYLYSKDSQQFEFISVLPTQFINVELQAVRRIDGNIVFFPINSLIRDILLYNVNTGLLQFKTMTNFLPGGDGIVKSSGIILRHDNISTVAYYE